MTIVRWAWWCPPAPTERGDEKKQSKRKEKKKPNKRKDKRQQHKQEHLERPLSTWPLCRSGRCNSMDCTAPVSSPNAHKSQATPLALPTSSHWHDACIMQVTCAFHQRRGGEVSWCAPFLIKCPLLHRAAKVSEPARARRGAHVRSARGDLHDQATPSSVSTRPALRRAMRGALLGATRERESVCVCGVLRERGRGVRHRDIVTHKSSRGHIPTSATTSLSPPSLRMAFPRCPLPRCQRR